MPPRKLASAPVPTTLESLTTPLLALPLIFTSSQHSIATHRKSINSLHALFLLCSTITTLSDDGKQIRLTGERAFGERFREAVLHPLGVKKGVEVADRVIKFVAGFVGFAVDYGEDVVSLFEGVCVCLLSISSY
jgi:condensin complex subunit 3